jgi:hypothetical protein
MTARGGRPTPTELRNTGPRGVPTYPLRIAERWHHVRGHGRAAMWAPPPGLALQVRGHDGRVHASVPASRPARK